LFSDTVLINTLQERLTSLEEDWRTYSDKLSPHMKLWYFSERREEERERRDERERRREERRGEERRGEERREEKRK
jgi:hypothetical protein